MYNLEPIVIKMMNERGVKLDDIADLVYDLQAPYYPKLTMEECLFNVEKVLQKREVQNAILTGVQIDVLAEQKKLEEPLQTIIEKDEGLYGIDEVIAFAIINMYGSIGFTNFGYIDKVKPGILKELNDHKGGSCHTFLDDIVGAIAAAASSRLAHSYDGTEQKYKDE